MSAQPEKEPVAVPPVSGDRPVPARPQYLEVVPDPEPETQQPAVPKDESQTQKDAATEPQEEPGGWRERIEQHATAALRHFQPPDFLHEDRPSLVKLWNYGRYTSAVPAAGPARALSIAWAAAVAIPATVEADLRAWVLERPSRAVVGAAVLSVLAAWEPSRVALSVLLYPLALLLDVVTNYPGVL